MMGCIALAYVLVPGCEQSEPHLSGPIVGGVDVAQVRSFGLPGESDSEAAGGAPIGLMLSNVLPQIEQTVSAAAVFGIVLYLYLRDGGEIIIPTSPVDVW